MMPSTPSSVKPVPANTSQEPSSSISNPPSSMKSELEHTDNYSTLNNSFQEKKTLPTTSPEVTTPLVKKLLISASTESENQLITAQVSKDSSFSTQSVVEPDQDLVPSFQRDFQSITEKNQNSASQYTPPPRSPPQSLNPTTQFFQLTHSLSTLMSLLCSTTKPSTISAEETSISKDPPIPTLTDLLLRSFHHSLHHSVSMVHSMLISLSSKPTWSHIPEFTLC